MDLETLKKLLAEGKITQEVFDEKVKELNGSKKPELTAELEEYIKNLIQSETDKVRTEYSKKLKDKEDELKRTQDEANNKLKTKMTEAEKAAFEQKLKDEQYEKEKAEFLKQKKEFNATMALQKYGLLDTELSFLDLVADDDENMIDLRCQKLKASIDAKVKDQVAQTFKNNGRDLGGSDNGGSGKTQEQKEAEFGKKLAENRKQEVEATKKAQDYYFGNN